MKHSIPFFVRHSRLALAFASLAGMTLENNTDQFRDTTPS